MRNASRLQALAGTHHSLTNAFHGCLHAIQEVGLSQRHRGLNFQARQISSCAHDVGANVLIAFPGSALLTTGSRHEFSVLLPRS
jgi:hypothetical protein